MLRIYYTILSLVLFCLSLQAAPSRGIAFVENRGQWSADVLYRADLPGGFLYLKKNSLHYVFYDAQSLADRHAGKPEAYANASLRVHGVEMELAGSRPDSRIEGLHRSAIPVNYFLGNNPAKWAGNVPSYAEIIYHNVYPGIDLRLYAFYETLKYEFIVQPNADPSVIQLVYQGADKLRMDDKRLMVETSVHTFRESQPYSYVSQNGKAIEVAANWELTGTTARFAFPNGYDRSQTLTIDPELVFATYTGSKADNWGHTATYDADGNLYAGGIVFGAQMTVSKGAYQVSFAGEIDVAIFKFKADDGQLLYSTFLGGSLVETPNSMMVNSKGELVIYGVTASSNFPTTEGAFSRKFSGGQPFTPSGNTAPAGPTAPVSSIFFRQGTDLFVSKLSPTGTSLPASTYVGGSQNDGLNYTIQNLNIHNYGDELRGEVVVDPSDRVFVSTVTTSANFPVTTGQFGGLADAIVLRLSADLRQLEWATFLGGSGYDAAYGLKQGRSGALFVTGVTHSTNLPGTTGAYQTTLGGEEDAFIARFTNDQLDRATYLGTASDEVGYLVDIDPEERPYVFGLTNGTYPVTAGTYRNTASGQFIHALSTDLRQSVLSTVVGSGRPGVVDISPTAFLINECGNIYLSGWGGVVNQRTGNNTASNTTNLPVTANAYKSTTNGSNFWIAVLEREAKSLLYATYMGSDSPANPLNDRGDHVDGGTCRFDKTGVIYHSACACGGTRFPTTPNAWSKTNNSDNCNNVAFKFNIDRLKAAFDTYEGTKKDVVEGCSPLTLDFVNTSEGGIRYEWTITGGPKSTAEDQVNYTFDKPGEYLVTLRAYNPLTCQLVDSAKRVITVRPANFRISRDTTLCAGQAVQLQAQGATKYTWTPAEGITTLAVANPVVNPQKTTTYTVDLANEFGCTARRSVTITIDESYRPAFELATSTNCGQPMRLEFTNKTANAERYVWSMGNGDTLRTTTPEGYQYTNSGRYEVTLTAYRNGCSLALSLPIDVENMSDIPNVITANGDGKNEVFDIGIRGARLEIYNRWGKLLYRSENYANDWGPSVPHGTYYYLMTTPSGTKCKGWLEVLQ
ncbi:hypothetical protein GCM10023189_16840 [Nibrella saemangeumensis]|uniref:PKD domain-containing protein n=1 Tax=Nibrella saemangeumensis TaxID=1084526 RepID=A0ABP8MP92_9BACT